MDRPSIGDLYSEDQRDLILEAIQSRISYYESKLRNYETTRGNRTDTSERYENMIYQLKEIERIWLEEAGS